MDTTNKPVEQLPIQLFESVIDIVAGEATMLFVPLVYTLATEEAERIGVDHVARHAMAQSSDSSGNSCGNFRFNFCLRLIIKRNFSFQSPNIWLHNMLLSKCFILASN